jgi:serine/threonine protein kinase
LKPSNLLLHPRPVAPPSEIRRNAPHPYERLVLLVGDLGSVSSRQTESFSADPHQGMTLEYMAPEMLFDEQDIVLANEKTDAWALGICLYRMAYKAFPWDSLVGPSHSMGGVQHVQKCVRTFIDAVAINTFEFPVLPSRSSALKRCIAALLTPHPDRRPSVSSLLQIDFIRSIKRARSSPLPSEQVPRQRPELARPPASNSESSFRPLDRISMRSTVISVAMFSAHFLLVSLYTPTGALALALATLEISLHVFALVKPGSLAFNRFEVLALFCIALLACSPLLFTTPLAFLGRVSLLVQAAFISHASSFIERMLAATRPRTPASASWHEPSSAAPSALAKRPRSGSALMRT